MKRTWIIPLLAFFGLGFGIFMIFYTSQRVPPPPILFPPPVSPYKHFVAGSGIIEASSLNIQIGTPFNEVITDVYVTEGDFVKANAPLFKLNTQTLEAELEQANGELEYAMVNYENQQLQFSFYQNLKDKNAVSDKEYMNQYYAVESAKALVDKAKGGVDVIQTNIDRSIIRAPTDGEVLQVNVRPGENANINPFVQNYSMVLFGVVDFFQVRVDIDEEDAWRVIKGKPATAFVRGNSSIAIPLEFVRIEPYVTPKQSLTGSNTERVDTRVLQVLFQFKKKDYPVYIGQMLDVYMESKPALPAFER